MSFPQFYSQKVLCSPEYRRKLKVQAAKKESFQLSGIQHPPKKTYNSLTDHHLSMFLSKPEVRRHLLKQKLVTREGVIVKHPEVVWRHQSQKKAKKSGKKEHGSGSSAHPSSSNVGSSTHFPPLNQTNTSKLSQKSNHSKSRLGSDQTAFGRETYGQGFARTGNMPTTFREDVQPIELIVQIRIGKRKTEREAHAFEEDGFGLRRYRLPKQEFIGFLQEVQAIASEDEAQIRA